MSLPRARAALWAGQETSRAGSWPALVPAGPPGRPPFSADARAGDDPWPWPVALTPLIGREDALADLVRLAPTARVLSIVGPGGAGKSRLALPLAESMRDRYSDGQYWLDLSAAPDGDLDLPGELARKLQVPPIPVRSLTRSVVDQLGSRRVLVVLDGCEHVVDACAALVESLLAGCRQVGLLVTSREPLKIAGETTWTVPMLSLPAADTMEAAAGSGAVQLFVERASAIGPDFALTEANVAAVARICRRLDGMPLALELAAARTRTLSVEELFDRLDDSLTVLADGGRRTPARHRTLRATLDWSYRLLSAAERRLLARLTVFNGTFTLDAVEEVCADDQARESILELFSQLIDKSLVARSSRGAGTRFRLLETVRSYGRNRLTEAGGTQLVADRHAAWYARLAASDDPSSDQRRRLDRLEAERENLRAALGLLVRTRRAEAAQRLAGDLWDLWYVRGHYREAQEWLESALGAGTAEDAAITARTLVMSGRIAALRCDYELASQRLEAGLRSSRELGDRIGVATALQALGSVARERGEYGPARSLHEQSEALWRELGDAENVVNALTFQGFAAWLSGDHERATALCHEALAAARGTGPSSAVLSIQISLAAAALVRGDAAGAQALLRAALADAHAHGFVEAIAWSVNLLGVAALKLDDRAVAADLLRESLHRQRELGDLWRVSSILDQLVAVVEPPVLGARLGGAATGLRDYIGVPVPAAEERDRRAALDEVARRLGPDRFRTEFDLGRALSVDRAIAEALEPGAESTPAPSAPPVVSTVAVEPPAATGPALRVEGFGATRIMLDGRVVEPARFTYAKPRELLFFLLERVDCTKDEIGAALWPWTSPARLRNSFHSTLHHLRQALADPDWVVFRAGRYGFDRARPYSYDVAEFTAARAAARRRADQPDTDDEVIALLEQAAAAYRGDFVPDLAGEDWIAERRDELRRDYADVLLELGTRQARAGRPEAAAGVLRRLVEHDPLVESAHRELMKTYAALGDRGRALRQYRQLAIVLRDELHTTPSPATAELAATLRRTHRAD